MPELSPKERFETMNQRLIGPMFLNLNDLKEESKEEGSKINQRALAIAFTKFEEFEMWLWKSIQAPLKKIE